MILSGRLVRFRLSPEGKVALRGLVEKQTLSAFVEMVDDLGAWIHIGLKKRATTGGTSVLMLLKWDYFSTAVLDYEPERPVKKQQIGFRSQRR